MNALEKNQSKGLNQNHDPALGQNRRGQNKDGFVLLTGLVVLVGASLLAFAVAKTSLFQEKLVGAEVSLHRDFEFAEIAVRERELELSLLTDLSDFADEDFANAECGIVKVAGNLVEGQVGGARIETTFYVPPPNGYNWGRDRKGSNVALCHFHASNTIYVSVNAIGDDFSKHLAHAGDYLGECGGGNTNWNTCVERFGDQPRRLSWTQIWE